MNHVSFVIPTYRLRQVSDTVKTYSGNFKQNGHDIPIIVFDDSDIATSQQYSGQLNSMDNPAGVSYVGPEEKAQFLEALQEKAGIDPILLKRIFKPSYGGNRNFTSVYTLGGLFISADDDMFPYGLFERNGELHEGEVARGRYIDRRSAEYYQNSQDIVSAYLDVLGKRVDEAGHMPQGSGVQDSMMELITNTTQGELGESRLSLIPGNPSPGARIKVAQTYRTGSSDVDAKDYAREFFKDPVLLSVNDMTMVYALSDFIPCVTDQNWRIDCGVAAYDNHEGLPPFIPTKLRFEDYVFRIWVANNPRVATAHVGAVQTHHRSPFNRTSIPKDYHNEELANYMKTELVRNLSGVGPLTVEFDGAIKFNGQRSRDMMADARALYQKAIIAAEERPTEERGYFINFANDLYHAFDGFNLDKFVRKSQERLSEEYQLLQDTMGVWPTIVEASDELDKPMRRMS